MNGIRCLHGRLADLPQANRSPARPRCGDADRGRSLRPRPPGQANHVIPSHD